MVLSKGGRILEMDVIKSWLKLFKFNMFYKRENISGRPKFAFILELTDLTAWLLQGDTPEFEPQAPTYQLCNAGRVT